MKTFWQDDDGFIISMELLIVSSLLAVGLATGLNSLRLAIADQFAAITKSIKQLNASFDISAISSTTGGSGGTIVAQDMPSLSP